MRRKIKQHLKSGRFARITCQSPRGRSTIERGYFLQISKQLTLLYECDDFQLRCYNVFPIQQIKKIRYNKNDKFYDKIMTAEGIKDDLETKIEVDITNWETLFSRFENSQKALIIESESKEYRDFLIGKITKVNRKSVWIRHFNAQGKLDKNPTKVKFKNITKVTFADRYIDFFSKYVYIQN